MPLHPVRHTGQLMSRFELGYPPSVNHLYATFNGRRVLSREGRDYHRTAGMQALAQRVRVQDGPLCVSIRVFRPARRGDLDNTAKAILDALKGVAWNDDSQIVELHLFRGDDAARPRAEIEVGEAPPF